MIEQLTRTSTRETLALPQYEIDQQASDIFEMMGLNAALAHEDLQEDVVVQLLARRDELLSEFLENPIEAFKSEFSLLKRLYEGRTMTTADGEAASSEFVTRDLEKNRADLHFREVVFASGNTKQVVEVPRREEDSGSFYISVQNDQLYMTHMVYKGYNQLKDVDPESELGVRLLSEFFTHSSKASGLVFDRPMDELERADEQAKEYLRDKLRLQHSI